MIETLAGGIGAVGRDDDAGTCILEAIAVENDLSVVTGIECALVCDASLSDRGGFGFVGDDLDDAAVAGLDGGGVVDGDVAVGCEQDVVEVLGWTLDVAIDDKVCCAEIIGGIFSAVAPGEDHEARVGVVGGLDLIDDKLRLVWPAVCEDDVAACEIFNRGRRRCGVVRDFNEARIVYGSSGCEGGRRGAGGEGAGVVNLEGSVWACGAVDFACGVGICGLEFYGSTAGLNFGVG